MSNKHVGLDLPSVVGMGISGPVLAFLTAALYAAFKGLFNWGEEAYAVIMLFLSAMLAAFPAIKSQYQPLLKLAMWPVATVMIFATAWGSSTGMSAGEEALASASTPRFAMAPMELPTSAVPVGVPMAPVSSLGWTNEVAQTNDLVIPAAWTNEALYDPDTINPRLSDEEMFKPSRVRGGFFKRMR